jgi:hypothetical protein
MREVLERTLPGLGLDFVERDVRDDPELERLYALEIPVLLREGHEIARHRITPDELRRRLSASSPSRR